MITIEGLGGKGSVWCAVRFGIGMKTNILHIDSYAKNRNSILTAPPCAIYLPPVGPSTTWWSTSASAYGPRLGQLEVGTLLGVTNSPDTPNPCMHSTITGGLLAFQAGSQNMPRWCRPLVRSLDGITYYTPSGAVAQFMQGANTAYLNYQEYGYNRKGEYLAVSNGSYNTAYAMLTDWCNPVGSSNPLFTSGATQSMWLASIPDRSNFSTTGLTLIKAACAHVSARVWKETLWHEYHHNSSYMPLNPVSEDTGIGFMLAKTKRERTITMVGIQSTRPATFSGRFDCTETITYYGMEEGTIHTTYNGEMSFSYSFDAPIMTLAPGLANGSEALRGPFDTYCAQAKPRAVILYKAKSATAARSDALADVTGLDSNWIENLAQVKGATKAILPLVNAWKAVKTGDINAGKRAIIDAYLTYMYVVAPGVRDYHDLKDNLGNVAKRITVNRFSQERRRGQLKTTVPVCDTLAELNYYCTLDLKLKDNPIAQIGNALESLGLNPSAANIWDLIPFSFVVDWFTGIGSILSRLDAYENNALLRDVKSRVETFKVLWPLTESELMWLLSDRFSVATPLKYVWYDRRILSGIGSYDPFAGQSHDGLSVSQMTQGAALLSSYKR